MFIVEYLLFMESIQSYNLYVEVELPRCHSDMEVMRGYRYNQFP